MFTVTQNASAFPTLAGPIPLTRLLRPGARQDYLVQHLVAEYARQAGQHLFDSARRQAGQRSVQGLAVELPTKTPRAG